MASAIEERTRPEDSPRTGVTHLDEAQRRWLANLYASNFTAVFRACQRVLHDPEDAADAAHEVFLRAVETVPLPSPGTSLVTSVIQAVGQLTGHPVPTASPGAPLPPPLPR